MADALGRQQENLVLVGGVSPGQPYSVPGHSSQMPGWKDGLQGSGFQGLFLAGRLQVFLSFFLSFLYVMADFILKKIVCKSTDLSAEDISTNS
jgi:hypothetical protein